MFVDVTGLPPLLVQVGPHEVLLDDAIGLAVRAADHDIPVRLQVWLQVPHVYKGSLLSSAKPQPLSQGVVGGVRGTRFLCVLAQGLNAVSELTATPDRLPRREWRELAPVLLPRHTQVAASRRST
ncbi:hypothetical protein [Streptomyces griseorubiginosus]